MDLVAGGNVERAWSGRKVVMRDVRVPGAPMAVRAAAGAR